MLALLRDFQQAEEWFAKAEKLAPERAWIWVERALIYEIDVVQRVVGLGRAARNQTRLRVRQPLARLLVRAPEERARAAVQRHRDQIQEELNVKGVAHAISSFEVVGAFDDLHDEAKPIRANTQGFDLSFDPMALAAQETEMAREALRAALAALEDTEDESTG